MFLKNWVLTSLFIAAIFAADAYGQAFIDYKDEPHETLAAETLAAFAQQQKIIETEGIRTNGFGSSVAVNGTTAVVGANLDDEGINADQGSAYVFVRSNGVWTLQARLLAADGAAGDLFGAGVAIAGETVIVGATKGDGLTADSGAAYVFTRSGSTWTQQAKLNGSDGAANDNFGFAVSIFGNTVAVGANLDDSSSGNSDQGSAYIFVRSGTTWTQQARLSDPSGGSQMFFGCSLALNGENLIVGANGLSGFAYLFTRAGTVWTLQTRFQSDDIMASDNFGSAVGISGDVLVVGAPNADVSPQTDQGAVYVFQRVAATGTILQTQKLNGADSAANDRFGASLGFDGTSIIAGAQFDDVGSNTDQGSAYVFTRNMAMMWTQQTQFIIQNGAANDRFSNSVAIAGNLAVSGALFRDVEGRVDQGAAYGLFRNSNNTWAQPDELSVSDQAANDFFGYSVDIEGNTAVVGAAFEDVGSKTDQGALYVYTKSGMTWSRQAKLLDANGAAGDALGYRVAISGDTIAAAAFSVDGANPDLGAIYVFVRSGTTWTQQAKLLANDAATFDYLGADVAIAGDTIVAGATGANISGRNDQGAAYVFTRNAGVWTQQAKFNADDGAVEDNFGWSVATNGVTAIIGVIGDDIGGNDGQGSAYVFTNNNGVWTQTQKLTMNDPQAATAFGANVALDGETFAVGAFFTTVNGNSTQGAAYVFTRTAGVWTQQAKLLADDGAEGDYFGSGVSLDGNNLLISAEYDNAGANTNQGSAYVFERSGTTWTQRQKIVGSDSAAFDSFGHDVAIDGANIGIGAPEADVINPNPLNYRNTEIAAPAASINQGAVYFYTALAPTAAGAVLGGRVINQQGDPIRNANVNLTGGNLPEPLTTATDALGNYRFENVPTGATYVVSASGGCHIFSESAQAVNLLKDEAAVDFVGQSKFKNPLRRCL